MKKKKCLIILLLLFLLIFCTSFYLFKNYNLGEGIKKNFTTITDKLSDNPKLFSVIMSKSEKELFINNVKQSKHYLEFGSGGSTFLALMNSNADVVSVENDIKWIKHLKEWNLIRKNDNKRLHFYYANTGKIGGYGWPTDIKADRDLFPIYSNGVFKDIVNNKYDLVLIDGRFRVACALQTILNTDDNVKILIHDFTNRPDYHEILKFLTIEKNADTMVLLRKKNNIDRTKVVELYEKYKYDYR